jgi:hypothetical protein
MKPNPVIAFLDSDPLSRAIKLAVIVLLLGVVWLTSEQRQLAQCQINYAEKSARATEQRAQAAEEDRKTLDRMVDAVANATTRDAPKAALVSYLNSRAAADQKRADNPLPAPPSQFCN